MAGHAKLTLGWQLAEPESDLPMPRYDQPPMSTDPREMIRLHEEWKRQCERDTADHRRDLARVRKAWHPVVPSGQPTIISCFGGTPSTVRAAVVTLTASLLRASYRGIRLIDLSQDDLLQDLRNATSGAAPSFASAFASVAANRTSMDLFDVGDADDLAGMIAGVLQSEGQALSDAMQTKQALLSLANQLERKPTVGLLAEAAEYALTGTPGSHCSLTTGERTALANFHVQLISRPKQRDLIDEVQPCLVTLTGFGPSGAQPVTNGRGVRLVKGISVRGGNPPDVATARRIVASYAAQRFARTPPHFPAALVVAGADHLDSVLLSQLTSVAVTGERQLILLFEHIIGGSGEPMLGAKGSLRALFFTLARDVDRSKASAFLGSSYRFVVNGHSLTWSKSEELSVSTSTTSDQSATRTKEFGRLFAGSLSRGFSEARQRAESRGSSTQTGGSASTARVHEPILEPEIFRNIPDNMMLVVDGDDVVLANCTPAIRNLPITGTQPWSSPAP